MRLLLASASPRRAELLRAAGIEFDVAAADIDESVLGDESPAAHVRRLAEAKARAVFPRVGAHAVLGADTVVVVAGAILGKPTDTADAHRMLRLISGRSHLVMTGICLGSSSSAGERHGPSGSDLITWRTALAVSTVEFASLSAAEIAAYVASGEPMDKAGAYAVQGRASRFVTRVTGSYSNVVGLPVALVYDLCKKAGLLVS